MPIAPRLLDVVAVLSDVPAHGLPRGQVGTIVELLKRHSGTSTRQRTAATEGRFAVCVRNDRYEASLERNKIYAVLQDDDAEHDGDFLVVDEAARTICSQRQRGLLGPSGRPDLLTSRF